MNNELLLISKFKKIKWVLSATRVLGYLTGIRVTDIEMGTRVPILITSQMSSEA